jgi:hypothetical protein
MVLGVVSGGVFLFFILALGRFSPCVIRGTDESSRFLHDDETPPSARALFALRSA